MPIPDGIDVEDFAAMMVARGCEVKMKVDPKKGTMALWVGTCGIKPKVG
jgi:hypothetical protein